MAASVRVEDEAFSDDRIAHLGELLGTSKYDALGRLAYLWRQATLMGQHALPVALIERHIAPIAALIDSGLGRIDRRMPGKIVLSGAEDRVYWLKNKRATGRANGAKGAEFGKLGGRPRKTPTKPPLGVTENPLTAPVTAPVTVTALVRKKICGGPRAAPEFASEAIELSECLREQLLAEKPNHAIGDDKAWAKRRPVWARSFSAILRKGHSPERVRELVAYVFGDQGGTEFRFVIESPSALDEKWDRIERAMVRKPPARHSGHFKVTGEEKYAGGVVEI